MCRRQIKYKENPPGAGLKTLHFITFQEPHHITHQYAHRTGRATWA